jgi:hypothetical protein
LVSGVGTVPFSTATDDIFRVEDLRRASKEASPSPFVEIPEESEPERGTRVEIETVESTESFESRKIRCPKAEPQKVLNNAASTFC